MAYKIKFIDSFRFMSSSLSSVVDNLSEGLHNHMHKYKYEYMVYKYEYMGSWERFDEELLPDKEAFYSSLNKEDITGVDYRHAKKSIQKL